MTVSKLGFCWRVLHMYIWSTPIFPSTPGTSHLLVGLFCSQGLLVCPLEYVTFSITHFYVFTSILLFSQIFWRTISADACQGFSILLWSKGANIRRNRLFLEGNYKEYNVVLTLSPPSLFSLIRSNMISLRLPYQTDLLIFFIICLITDAEQIWLFEKRICKLLSLIYLRD